MFKIEHFSLLRISSDIVFAAMQIHEQVLEDRMSDVLYHGLSHTLDNSSCISLKYRGSLYIH